MKKIYLSMFLAIVAIAGACKKENKSTTNSTDFNIVGYWQADGNMKSTEYDKNGKVTSTEEVDITAKPVNYDAGSFVDYHFRSDAITLKTSIKYDKNFNKTGYETTVAKYKLSNITSDAFTLTITESDNETYDVITRINSSNSMTFTVTKINDDGSKHVEILTVKKAPTGYNNPAGN